MWPNLFFFNFSAHLGYVTHLHTVQTKVFLLHVYEVPVLQSGAYHCKYM